MASRCRLRSDVHDVGGIEDWLRLQHHALATAEGPVVNRPMPIMGEAAQIVSCDLDQTRRSGAAENSVLERTLAKKSGKIEMMSKRMKEKSNPESRSVDTRKLQALNFQSRR